MNQGNVVVPMPISAHLGPFRRPAATPRAATPRTVVPEREVVNLPLSLLVLGSSPRLEGLDQAHIARLADVETPLPPILVDRRTMQVIDGAHRVLAAWGKGLQEIAVEFFDGAVEDIFLRSVEVNVKHGYPLSRADRRAAAARIIVSHPHLSDRAIAEAAGLGAKTVASIRRLSGDGVPQPAARIGKDGRARPLSGAEGRLKVAELLAEQPEASIRAVARAAGVSPTTAADVRRRLDRGEDPVPAQAGPADRRAGGGGSGAGGGGGDMQRAGRPPTVFRRSRPAEQDPTAILAKLVRDPSLRDKEEGRQLLRLLQQNAVGLQDRGQLAAAVPSHGGNLVAQLARQYAQLWTEFAQEVEGHLAPTPMLAAG